MKMEKRLRKYVKYLRDRAAYLSDNARKFAGRSVYIVTWSRGEAKAEGLREAAAGLEQILSEYEQEGEIK